MSIHFSPQPTTLTSGWSPLALALVLDWLLGEPPDALHPVAWFGQLVAALERRAPREQPGPELLYGAGIVAVGVGTAALFGYAVERTAGRLNRYPGLTLLCVAGMLKTTFAWRALLHAGAAVRQALEAEQPDRARYALRALVSRDTAQLDPPLLAAAAIESLAENASDAFVAPLFYYQLFGLPGACAYRAINTLDAMLGYRGRYEFLGKIPARLDDLVNWLPARLTALAIVGAAALLEANPRHAWQIMWRDHPHTASPNAGYPMSAMAGALDVCLEKMGHYRLNAGGRAPTPTDIRRASRIVTLALGLVVVAGAAVRAVLHKQ